MRGRLAIAVAVGLVATPLPARGPDRALESVLAGHIKTLASDEFLGREPGTEGEKLALRYLARQWFEIGLVSGTNDPGNAWYAPVSLVERTPARSMAAFQRNKRPLTLPAEGVLVLTSGARQLLENAPLLFLGRPGEGLPPRSELAGRIAVILDGTIPGDGPTPGDRLLEAGAAAVLTVLDGDRSLEQVAARRARAGYALASDSLGGDLEAFVTLDFAAKLFGAEWPELLASAGGAAFAPRLLPMSGTLEATTRETRIETHNLIGKLPGRNPGTGAVLVLAHWDHFGSCATPPAEDLICNGAIDNASGLAVMTETARALAKGKKLDRDVYFLATTGEEVGLLGAHAFAENPPLPLESIVAAFNIDSPAIGPGGLPLAIVGRGRTPLDAPIARVAKSLKMKLRESPAADALLRRQDGWALLQHDVPAVMVGSNYSDQALVEKFMDEAYHRPADEFSPNMELGGAAENVKVQVALVRWFATAKNYAMPRKR